MNTEYRKDFFQQTSETQRVTTAIKAMENGDMVIMVDDEDRENEGDLVFPAEKVTPEKINFMAKEARGLICLALESNLVESLGLPMMAEKVSGTSHDQGTAFTVSIEAKTGVTTGISASDRAQTIKVATSANATMDDLKVPGHIFPLRARPGGVLVRAGHTEGSVDLAKMAGQKGAAAICEIMNEDGTMARRGELIKFSEKHKIPIVTIRDLIHFRSLNEVHVVERRREPSYSTDFGDFQGIWFESTIDQKSHFVLTKGDITPDSIVQVRVQKQQGVDDVFAGTKTPSSNCPRKSINYGLEMLKNSESGVLVYIQSDPFGYTQKETHWDPRLYGVGAQILKSLGIKKMCLHVNKEKSLVGLEGFGLHITETKLMS